MNKALIKYNIDFDFVYTNQTTNVRVYVTEDNYLLYLSKKHTVELLDLNKPVDITEIEVFSDIETLDTYTQDNGYTVIEKDIQNQTLSDGFVLNEPELGIQNMLTLPRINGVRKAIITTKCCTARLDYCSQEAHNYIQEYCQQLEESQKTMTLFGEQGDKNILVHNDNKTLIYSHIQSDSNLVIDNVAYLPNGAIAVADKATSSLDKVVVLGDKLARVDDKWIKASYKALVVELIKNKSNDILELGTNLLRNSYRSPSRVCKYLTITPERFIGLDEWWRLLEIQQRETCGIGIIGVGIEASLISDYKTRFTYDNIDYIHPTYSLSITIDKNRGSNSGQHIIIKDNTSVPIVKTDNGIKLGNRHELSELGSVSYELLMHKLLMAEDTVEIQNRDYNVKELLRNYKDYILRLIGIDNT